MEVQYFRDITEGDNRTKTKFRSNPQILLSNHDLDEQLIQMKTDLNNLTENFENMGSGWNVENILGMSISVAKYDSIGGSTYIPTPTFIEVRKAIINIKNYDDRCFAYCVAAHLHPSASNKNKTSSYQQYINELNFTNMNFPITLDQIRKFEGQNKDISIGVLYHDEETNDIYPLYATKEYKRKTHINLLLLQEINPLTGQKRMHYTLITNLGRLLSHKSKNNNACYPCIYCLHRFSSEDKVQNHIKICGENDPCKITFPSRFPRHNNKKAKCKYVHPPLDLEEEEETESLEEHLNIDRNMTNRDQEHIRIHTEQYCGRCIEDEEPPYILRFKEYQKMLPVPFAIYADFESFIDSDGMHTPSGFCTFTKSNYPEFETEPYLYSGEGVMDHFYNHLQKENERIKKILNRNIPMKPLTKEQQDLVARSDFCHYCRNLLVSKYRDHDHITGNFRAVSCNRCNLSMKPVRLPSAEGAAANEEETEPTVQDYYIPVIMHNAKKYDNHIVIKYLESKYGGEEIQVLATNTENFIAMQIGNFRFLDSFQFLPSSLDSLVESLKKDGEDKLKYTKKIFPKQNEFNLINQKGVYPYEFMENRHKFSMKNLPSKENFYSKLNESEISENQYEHAKTVWKTFQMENMQQYHDLYLTSDCLLLTDVFENFREFSLKYYRLDPLHFYTGPGLSWSAALLMCDVRIKLLTDIDMLLFFQKMIRGGVSTISHRLAEANNPFTEGAQFDETKDTTYLQYYDANNLYGYDHSFTFNLI